MKLISMAVISALTLFGAEAAQMQPKELRDQGAQAPKADIKQRDFGVYRVVQAASSGQQQAKGSQRLTKGVVVENVLTGQRGQLTGRLTVLAASGLDVHGLARELGIKVEAGESRTGLYLLDATGSADLAALKATLAARDGIRQVKIDVLDNRNREY